MLINEMHWQYNIELMNKNFKKKSILCVSESDCDNHPDPVNSAAIINAGPALVSLLDYCLTTGYN